MATCALSSLTSKECSFGDGEIVREAERARERLHMSGQEPGRREKTAGGSPSHTASNHLVTSDLKCSIFLVKIDRFSVRKMKLEIILISFRII